MLDAQFKLSRGSALLLATLVLTTVLGIGLGLSTIMVQQIKIGRSVGFFVPAFYAADAGVEKMLYRTRKDPGFSGAVCKGTSGQDPRCDYTYTLSQTSYTAHIYEPSFGDPAVGTCPVGTLHWCIFGTGFMQDFTRRMRASF